MSMSEAGHGSAAEAPSANEGARGLVLRQPDRDRAAALERVARFVASAWMRRCGHPPGIEYEDLLQEARIAAWRADQSYDAARGEWETWVGGAAWQAMREAARTPAFGALNRRGYGLATVSLDAVLYSVEGYEHNLFALHWLTAPDTGAEFLAVELRASVAALRQRLQPRHRATLDGVFLDGRTYAEYAAVIGRGQSLVKLRVDALLGAAREAWEA